MEGNEEFAYVSRRGLNDKHTSLIERLKLQFDVLGRPKERVS